MVYRLPTFTEEIRGKKLIFMYSLQFTKFFIGHVVLNPYKTPLGIFHVFIDEEDKVMYPRVDS